VTYGTRSGSDAVTQGREVGTRHGATVLAVGAADVIV
jgi:hypothetical protein